MRTRHDAFWRYLPDAERASVAARLEQTLRAGMTNASTTSLKSAYFAAFRRTVTTRGRCRLSRAGLAEAGAIAGLTFAENDFIDMAQELALRHVTGTDAILAEQHGRIANPDRKARFAFVMPALSPDARDARRIFRQPVARREPRSTSGGSPMDCDS